MLIFSSCSTTCCSQFFSIRFFRSRSLSRSHEKRVWNLRHIHMHDALYNANDRANSKIKLQIKGCCCKERVCLFGINKIYMLKKQPNASTKMTNSTTKNNSEFEVRNKNKKEGELECLSIGFSYIQTVRIPNTYWIQCF